MAEEEATPAPEENAEATDAAEAGAEAAAEAPAEAAAPPSLWKPVILSSIICIVGVVAIFKFLFMGEILSKIAELDPNATDKNATEEKKDDKGEEGDGGKRRHAEEGRHDCEGKHE